MDLGLANATAVVAGGGRGMGLAAARALAEEGARIAVLARTRDDVDRVALELSNRGSPDAVGCVADVRDKEEIDQLFAALSTRWGGAINVLINAVGPTVLGTVESLSDEQWRVAVDDGVLGMVHCVTAALPHMRRAEWARIVNFSASSTRRQSISLAAYTASKAMVTSVSKNLSLLLAPDGILVNVVSPGTVVSEGLIAWARSVGVDSTDPHELMSAVDSHYGHPCHLSRAGQPDEIGSVATFLASRRNSYMTGADVNVDGGTDFT